MASHQFTELYVTPPDKTPTHIMMQFAPTQLDRNLVGSREDLFRASDGMLIASRVHTMVQYGEDPVKVQQRNFLSEDFAMDFIRKLAQHDLGTETTNKANIEYRDAESKIATPANGEIAKYARN